MRIATCLAVLAIVAAGCTTTPAEHTKKIVYVPRINEAQPSAADSSFCLYLFSYLANAMKLVQERDMFLAFAKLSSQKLINLGESPGSPGFEEGMQKGEAFLGIASADERNAAKNSCMRAMLGAPPPAAALP